MTVSHVFESIPAWCKYGFRRTAASNIGFGDSIGLVEGHQLPSFGYRLFRIFQRGSFTIQFICLEHSAQAASRTEAISSLLLHVVFDHDTGLQWDKCFRFYGAAIRQAHFKVAPIEHYLG